MVLIFQNTQLGHLRMLQEMHEDPTILRRAIVLLIKPLFGDILNGNAVVVC